jgi:hypothetical protein
VFLIHRLTPDERLKDREGNDNLFIVSKNRDDGTLAKIGLKFEQSSKRFRQTIGTTLERYGWEDEL